MTLIDDFFYIKSCDEQDGKLRITVRLNADHAIYKAHFPATPVTPGACIIQIACELLARHVGRPLVLKVAKSIRHRQFLLPADEPCYTFSNIAWNGDEVSAYICVEQEKRLFARMSLVLAIDGGKSAENK